VNENGFSRSYGIAGRARHGAVALLAATLSLLAFGATVSAQPSRKAFRAQRVCAAPPPGRAACLGLRLISRSLSPQDLHERALRQAREVAERGRAQVTSKEVPGGLTPANLHSAYSLATETPAGATQTIGIVDAYNDPHVEADLAVYDKAFGLGACTTANGCFRRINESGKTSPLPASNGEWASEISLDVQMAHAICQNCRILLVEAASERWDDFGAAENAAVSAGATVISNSYGGTEASGYEDTAYDHPGVVVTVSSGDCGYRNEACNWNSVGANFPAASPHVVAVGGTSLTNSGGSWSSTVWKEGGSACSHVFSAASWQSAGEGFSATGCSGRAIADVSAVGDPYTGVDVYDSTPSSSGASTGWGVWGGTSAASPIVAGEFGLAGGARGIAYAAKTLYAHLGEAGALYDVVSGSNGSCGSATVCKASKAFDAPTGVGSPVGLSAFSVSGAPTDVVEPTVSGTAEQAQTLTATSGEWSATPTSYAYQWESCESSGSTCTAISGATSSTLTVTAGAIGHTLRVVVSASNATGGGTPVASAATAVVVSDVPAVTSLSPSSAITGATITITGTAFTGATQVRFGSLSASFQLLSSTQIEATVPSGASAGTIAITTPLATGKSTLTFTPTLSITGESPSRAAVGAVVTIRGVGFNSGSAVSFNGVKAASVTFVSSTTLKATVPAGASTGLISVTNASAPSGTVKTAGSFVVA
jgi:subtilase family serine protease